MDITFLWGCYRCIYVMNISPSQKKKNYGVSSSQEEENLPLAMAHHQAQPLAAPQQAGTQQSLAVRAATVLLGAAAQQTVACLLAASLSWPSCVPACLRYQLLWPCAARACSIWESVRHSHAKEVQTCWTRLMLIAVADSCCFACCNQHNSQLFLCMQWSANAVQASRHPLWSHVIYQCKHQLCICCGCAWNTHKVSDSHYRSGSRGWLMHITWSFNHMGCWTDCAIVFQCCAERICKAITFLFSHHSI